ncbi:MAG TPA: helix-turn-helix domain-containing protein [Verrucomicrobiota bacterium]|nr:helix-turn-helix domain-containing protein [Verrucomicrobiota bacterium]
MTGLEDLVQAAMSAPPERREEALRLLQGRLPKPEPFLTLAELSQRLGFSTTTLRRWRVPGHDLGAHPRYRLTEVEAYLASGAFRRRQAAVRAERRNERASAQFHFSDGLPRPSRRQLQLTRPVTTTDKHHD